MRQRDFGTDDDIELEFAGKRQRYEVVYIGRNLTKRVFAETVAVMTKSSASWIYNRMWDGIPPRYEDVSCPDGKIVVFLDDRNSQIKLSKSIKDEYYKVVDPTIIHYEKREKGVGISKFLEGVLAQVEDKDWKIQILEAEYERLNDDFKECKADDMFCCAKD